MAIRNDDERELGTEEQAEAWSSRLVERLTPAFAITRAIDVPVDNFDRLAGEVRRLFRKAEKLDVPPPLLLAHAKEHVVTRLVWELNDDGVLEEFRRRFRVVRCVVAGQELRLNGWEVIAAVDWLDGKPVVRALPGRTLEAWHPLRSPHCDHCNAVRARNTTYLLVDAEGHQRQVGSTCLLDFCGIDPTYAAQVAALYEAGGVGPGTRYEADLGEALEWWCLATRLHGFVSHKAADAEDLRSGKRPFTTVEEARVLRNAAASDPEGPDVQRPTEEDRALAEAVTAYVRTLDPNQSTYEASLRAIFDSGILLHKHEGLAASAIGSYQREQARVAEARAKARFATRPSRWLGDLGAKVEVEALVVACTEREGDYGPTWIYRLVTTAGDRATWFSSREALTVGHRYTLAGTVKKLEDYRGEQQTVLTRCRALADLGGVA